jgi:hypothetical protein
MLQAASYLNFNPATVENRFITIPFEIEDHVVTAIAIRLWMIDVVVFAP